MASNILMPALFPGALPATLAKWFKKEGDLIRSGDVVLEIETDKATMEVEAVDDGTLLKIVVPEGTSGVAVNTIVGVMTSPGEDGRASAGAPSPKITDQAAGNVRPTSSTKLPLPSGAPPSKTAERPAADVRQASSEPPKIFLVHGHEEGAKQSVARFLEKIGFDVVILHERSNKGNTLIEKFEENSDVKYAVVLLTPDDDGSPKGGVAKSRARQNVVFEWGFFVGRLGRTKVCALKRDDVELPSDVSGIIWEVLDAHGAWKSKLAKEIEDAGLNVDWSRVGRA